MDEAKVIEKCVFVVKSIIDASLASEPYHGKHLLDPLKTLALKHNLSFNLLEDMNVSDNICEIHAVDKDLWIGISGEMIFTVGGELVEPWIAKKPDGTEGDPRELRAKQIRWGAKIILRPGDRLEIPPGVAHTHARFPGNARAEIIKVPDVSMVKV